MASRDGQPPWSTNAFVCTVRKIEHHDVVISGIFGDKFSEKNPQEWTTQASTTVDDATEEYMAEVIAESTM